MLEAFMHPPHNPTKLSACGKLRIITFQSLSKCEYVRLSTDP